MRDRDDGDVDGMKCLDRLIDLAFVRAARDLREGVNLHIFGGKTSHGHRVSIALVASTSCEQRLTIAWRSHDLKENTLVVNQAYSG